MVTAEVVVRSWSFTMPAYSILVFISSKSTEACSRTLKTFKEMVLAKTFFYAEITTFLFCHILSCTKKWKAFLTVFFWIILYIAVRPTIVITWDYSSRKQKRLTISRGGIIVNFLLLFLTKIAWPKNIFLNK